MDQTENKNEEKLNDFKFIDEETASKKIDVDCDALFSSSSSSNQKTSVELPWDRFSYWAHAILVVTFDLELGQSIEVLKKNMIYFR
jgi:hypothetical protein